jgi:hypothetical protein
MGWLADTSTYTRKVKDPTSDAEAEVTFRVLNAHDSALIEDEITLREGADGGDEMKPLIGTRTLMTVQRAVVAWTLPGLPAPTAQIIASLHPGVIAQLFAHASFGAAPKDDPPTVPPVTPPAETVEPSDDDESLSTKPTSSVAGTGESRVDL